MNNNDIERALNSVAGALFDAFADDVNEDGTPIISDSDTLDDFISIIDIINRMESRKMRALNREHESIL